MNSVSVLFLFENVSASVLTPDGSVFQGGAEHSIPVVISKIFKDQAGKHCHVACVCNTTVCKVQITLSDKR
jgi:hypothetical protein